MVGNDIIDIQETKRTTNWERAGFMQKIFTPEEQSIVTTSADSFTTAWRLWSMKESAYKVFIQNGGTRFYNPTKIECRLDSSRMGQAQIGHITLNTVTSIHSDYMFSTASLENSDVDSSIFQLKESTSEGQSQFMHEQVLKGFAEKNSLNPEELALQKTAAGVPVLYYQNQLLDTSISLTHHGNYGAYSFLRNSFPVF